MYRQVGDNYTHDHTRTGKLRGQRDGTRSDTEMEVKTVG